MIAVTTALLVGLASPISEIRTYKVEGVERRAMIFAPSMPSEKPPVVFAFHGHGGNMRSASRSFHVETEWPEAVVIYMSGLPTVGRTDPKGEKPGWQKNAGELDDRDLKFFDAVYKDVHTRFDAEPGRTFALGHSNGGRFTHLLWEQRPSLFAAFGPSGSTATTMKLEPKPFIHIMGEKDPLVSPANQRATIEKLLRVDSAKEPGKPIGKFATRYESSTGNPVVTYIHPGGHEYPDAAVKVMVDFFKSLIKK